MSPYTNQSLIHRIYCEFIVARGFNCEFIVARGFYCEFIVTGVFL